METDNGKRGSNGVVLSLVAISSGQLRLTLDDVKNISESKCGPWKNHVLFTFKDYSADDIKEHKLSDKELADIGFHVLVRLGVLHEHPIN